MMDATPELRGERLKNMGAQRVAHLESLNPERDRADARVLYAQVKREFSDVAYRDGTLGEAAAERLLPLDQTYPELGMHAPSLVGTDLQGNPLALEDYRGTVVVITFWASWCGACIDRIPEENQLIADLQGADFHLFGVNSDEMIDEALRSVEEHSIDFRSWWDDPAAETKIVNQWGVTAWPTTFVIDQSGFIRYKNLSGSELRRVVFDLLKRHDASAKSTDSTAGPPQPTTVLSSSSGRSPES
jgi:thiol-disulfide isomerase/thioredoxin